MRAVGKDLVRRGVTQGPWASTRGVAVKLLHNHKVEFYTAHKKGDIKKENRDASINFLRLLKQMSADLALQPHSYHLGHPGAGVPERRCGQGLFPCRPASVGAHVPLDPFPIFQYRSPRLSRPLPPRSHLCSNADPPASL